MENEVTDFAEIDRLLQRLDSHRPLPPAVVVNLRESLVLRWTYHSNAIEGNTLTMKETKVVLEGITVGGKTMREHCEAINHRAAIELVENLATEAVPLSESQIKSIHQIILTGIDNRNAGVYRRVNVEIVGAVHTPPDFARLPDDMRAFIRRYETEAAALHPVERAARVHADFVKIHPFADGNGRTSRLLMNLELMKNGFPPAVVAVENRLAYYETLDTAHTQNNYAPFVAFIADAVKAAFAPYWHALGIAP